MTAFVVLIVVAGVSENYRSYTSRWKTYQTVIGNEIGEIEVYVAASGSGDRRTYGLLHSLVRLICSDIQCLHDDVT